MEDDGLEPLAPYADEIGRPTLGGAIGYILAYVLLACFVGYLFFAL